VDGTLLKLAAAAGYCSVDGTLLSVLAFGYCSTEDGTLVKVESYLSPDEVLLNTAPVGAYFSSDATRTSVPDDGGGEYGCSVDGTRFRFATATTAAAAAAAAAVVLAYCSADGTRVIVEYCSTEMVLVRVPPAIPPLALDATACCSVDGILVRVPRLLAEQLVVIIVEVPLKATDRRFGL
jgi:hypothetical protein